MNPRTEKRKLTALDTSFFVREKLNTDQVQNFKRLYETGAQVPPLKVAHDGLLIDGRHRKAALEILGRMEAMCEILHPKSRAEAIAMALAANVGGSLPPTPHDINHVIRLFIDEGLKTGEIVSHVMAQTAAFPEKLIRDYVREVIKNLGELKLNRAVAAVRDDNLTVADAAKRFGVEVASIRNKMRSKKSDSKHAITNVLGGFSSKFKSLSTSLVKGIVTAERLYDEGLVDEKYVSTILEEVGRHVARLSKTHEERNARFRAKTPGSGVSEPKQAKAAAASKKKAAPHSKDGPANVSKGTSVLEKMGLSRKQGE
jgi:hypothetical protein